ncbi:hypothetical protein [Lysinibacter cavernae]|uniref:ABC transporter substrate-binding protein n=1 Tax=Lysinibacter cavernae TaxID=1640652 RepID=A0A7X5TT86_9MICO|nr:hypothetical protein [Lysinibacter cavernae]NIH53875.1 hypothetical protein [Lysinibacter cavernae]
MTAAKRAGFVVTAVLGVSLLAGCADMPVPAAEQTSAPSPSGDRVLVIGHLADPATAAATAAGSELALADIRLSGAAQPVDSVRLEHRGALPTATVVDELAYFSSLPADVVISTPQIVAKQAGEAAVVQLPESSEAPEEAFVQRLRTIDPSAADATGAAEAYDATIIVALAALAANDDGAASLRSTFASVIDGDVVCSSYGECATALADKKTVRYQALRSGWSVSDDGQLNVAAAKN